MPSIWSERCWQGTLVYVVCIRTLNFTQILLFVSVIAGSVVMQVLCVYRVRTGINTTLDVVLMAIRHISEKGKL